MRRSPGSDFAVPEHADIGDYGLIGDMRTAALVDRWGRIDWLCWPRFDSPPLLRRLLDARSGCWQFAPAVPFDTTRRYLPDTNVLETTFASQEGVVVGTDFMTVPRDEATGSQVVRIVEGRAGAVPVRLSFAASDGFEGGPTNLRGHDRRVQVVTSAGTAGVLSATGPLTLSGDKATLEVTLEPGQRVAATLRARASSAMAADPDTMRESTARWWRSWIGRCRLPEVKRDAVVRSALALKLLHYQPTNALVAAATTSLPEDLGGVRNWDYRYTWLRDASMMVLALQYLGQHEEAMGFWGWLENTADRHGEDLAVAYTVDGEHVPTEWSVTGLTGYRGSRPVNVGNAASSQRQHDVYGHVMAAAAHCYHHMDNMDFAAPRELLPGIADLAAERWHLPDDSIWEVRGDRSRHSHSLMMSWLALDLAVDLADEGALDGDRQSWAASRGAAHRAVLREAWDETLGAFTGTLGGGEIDSAALVAPLIGLLPPDDPRCRSTRRVVTEQLSAGGLLRRYVYDDGLEGEEGAFLLCTLWLADSHTLDRDPDHGEELIERVLRTGNDLGLLAEEADFATGAPLGNFPQGLTHLGIVQSVVRLAKASR